MFAQAKIRGRFLFELLQMPKRGLPQRCQTQRGVILQRRPGAAVVGENGINNPPRRFHRQRKRINQPGREINQMRISHGGGHEKANRLLAGAASLGR